MYAYSLLVQRRGGRIGCEPVRPGPDMEIPNVEELRAQVGHDLGFVPDWLLECPADEYVQVEDEHQIDGTWFIFDIEGSSTHKLPALCERIAWARAQS